ncbi:MAG: LacI family transcriptional regulator [Gaiellaceae bacterium MAG52_C11]|nr:LacI family transcriptional regulator [Candidatus Gaiellasilicea maunaloa]
MLVRLLDVAGQAGVSEATVSRALSGKPGVSQTTREAVLAVADTLGYSKARSAPTRTALMGIVVPELENPVFAAFAQCMTTLLAQAGHTPMLGTETASGVSEDDWIEMMLERDASGIIFVSGMHADTHASPARYRRLRSLRVPIVLVNGPMDGVDAGCISADDATAARIAVDHLSSLGHTQIGLAVGPERYVPVIRRVAGFERATAHHDLDDSLVEHSLFTLEGGHVAASRLLDQGATAIICASDLMAFGAIRACRASGLSVPGDVSIVGHDNSALVAFAGPPLTTIRQAVPEMSRAAVRMLLGEVAGTAAPREEYLFQPELVVRSSTGAAPPKQRAEHRTAGTGRAVGVRRRR